MVQILLEKGADVNAGGKISDGALHAASYGGHEKIVELLLKKGGNISARDFDNALQAASQRRHEKIVELLKNEEAKFVRLT